MALFTLPTHSLPWLPPCASKLLQLLFNLGVAICIHVARVTSRPFLQLRWLARAFGASNVSTLFANSGVGRNKYSLAFVAGAPDSLLGWLIRQFVSSFGRNGQDSLLLRLLFYCGLRFLLALRLPLGVSRALFTTLVLTVRAHLLRPVDGTTTVAVTMHTHPNRLLHPLHSWLRSGRCDPVV
jgi:hypothetical protein